MNIPLRSPRHSQTGRDEKDRKRLASPEEKIKIALNVVAIACAFKANVLHALKTWMPSID